MNYETYEHACARDELLNLQRQIAELVLQRDELEVRLSTAQDEIARLHQLLSPR